MLMPKEHTSSMTQATASLVVFRLDRVHYAIAIEPILQIIEMVTITPVLKTEDWVEGIINYHGDPIPVVNLRRHFRMEAVPHRWHTPIILLNLADRQVGLIVDDVLDVLALSPDQILDPRSILPASIPETPLLKGLIQTQENMILLIDLAYLFDQQQLDALSAAVEALNEQALQAPEQKTEPDEEEKP